MSAQRPPVGLGTAGKRLWRAVQEDYELDVHEALLLREACRTVDVLDRLHAEAAGSPVTVENFRGDMVAHPAITEARQQALVFTRLVASLRLPSGDEGDMVRPQRRGAPRGAYGIRGSVSQGVARRSS